MQALFLMTKPKPIYLEEYNLKAVLKYLVY